MTQIPDWEDSVYSGWHPILRRTHAKLVAIHPEYNVGQLKQKFGGLRIYLDSSPSELYKQVESVVREAEYEAYKTCEYCGDGGQLRQKPTGWYITACESCQPDSVVMED